MAHIFGTFGQRVFQIVCLFVLALGLYAVDASLDRLLPSAAPAAIHGTVAIPTDTTPETTVTLTHATMRAVHTNILNVMIVIFVMMAVLIVTAQAKAQYWAAVKGTRPLKTFAEDMRHHAVQLSTALADHGVSSVEVQNITATLRARLQERGCPWEEVQTLSFAIEQLTECLTKYWQHTSELQVQQASEDMAKQVAHDMRSPVTILMSVLRLCRNRAQDDQHLQAITRAENSVARLARMADDLCNVAKARMIHRQATDIAALARDTVDAIRTAQVDARVTLHYVGPENFSAAVDADKMTRVLTNLVHNGVQAIPTEQSGAVTLSLSATEEEIQFVVHDTGSGMSEATQAKLFQRLFTTKGAGGTGLGLAYCKDVITGHGGEIRGESAQNMGSTFRVTIPTPLIPATPVLHLIDGGKPSVAVIEG